MTLDSATHPSSLGDLMLLADDDHLHGVYLRPEPTHATPRPAATPFAAAHEQLDAYFARELKRFDLPLARIQAEHKLAGHPYDIEDLDPAEQHDLVEVDVAETCERDR